MYYDSHTLCDGSGLFFRDAMTLFTMVQVGVCVLERACTDRSDPPV